ncbi:hypothetical protein FD754_019817 [Muntiacus muntjak]|uniref:Dachshund family transcription factor 1 n=1 Tax=Muntiacus muntjak TaxID=9888 RepID=A0A5N3V358_MUNMU|nr:hypothetical protein FD754_019817 [Muntiacus muntjak]
MFVMTSAFSWQNSNNFCPASFCTPRPNLPVTPGLMPHPGLLHPEPLSLRHVTCSIFLFQSHTDETPLSTPTARDSLDKLSLTGHGQPLPPGFPSPFLFPDGLSSIETLLTNIQGLLKVAIDNARAQEKQVQLEKTELKMDFLRERELRETLEKQLAMEQKNRAIVQKRLKKEKKAKRKLQEALEFETKRREQAEQTLKQAASTDSLRVLNDSLTPEIEGDRSGGRTDAERTIQGSIYSLTSILDNKLNLTT